MSALGEGWHGNCVAARMLPSRWSRSLTLTLTLVLLPGCPESHAPAADASAEGGACGSFPELFCVPFCGGDASVAPVCEGGAWVCPMGTRDRSTCEPACGVRPYEGCACTPAGWSCVDIPCPTGLGPGTPGAPGDACTVPGATCGSSSGGCGLPAFACRCDAGRWQCETTPIDPVCTCGREPREGDPCLDERAVCGSCCPAPGDPAWSPMICLSGRWSPLACAGTCEPQFCPVDTASAIGRPCPREFALCGELCCGTAISCYRGVWGPQAASCDPPGTVCRSFACGEGTCSDLQYCRSGCDAAGRPEFTCGDLGLVVLPGEGPTVCRACDCLTRPPGSVCTELDGHVFVRDAATCG